MAAFAFTNAFLSVNGTDVSDHVKSVELTLDGNVLDPTTMGSVWTKAIGGVKSGSLAVEFLDDFAAAEIDSIVYPLFNDTVPFVLRPDAGAKAAGNPEYTGFVTVSSFSVGAAHGELPTKSLTWPTSGAVARGV
jgi:hypothetical protein